MLFCGKNLKNQKKTGSKSRDWSKILFPMISSTSLIMHGSGSYQWKKIFFRYLRFSPQNHARMVQRDKFQLLQNTYCCLNWASAKLPTQKWPFLKRHLNIFFMKPLRLASRMNNGNKLYSNFKAFHQRDSIRLGSHSVRVSRSSFQVL